MWKDPIIEETRKRRDELAQKLGGELEAICKALQEREAKTTRKVVSLQPRKTRPFLSFYASRQAKSQNPSRACSNL